MRIRPLLQLLLILVSVPLLAQSSSDDLAAARALFQKNIDAIRRHDRDTYLSYYVHSPELARNGPTGVDIGFDEFAKGVGARWPDQLDADDLRLVGVAPGVVYGSYRYRVRYGTEEHVGVSERLFLRTADGWRVAVTGAIDTPPGTPPPPRAIVGGTIVDGNGGPPVADGAVVVRGGKIDCVGTRAQCLPAPLEGLDVTDVRGMWIVPGLIDSHVHFSQTGWIDGRPDAVDARDRHPYESVEADLRQHPERFFRSYLCSGVTSVFDVGGYAWTLALPKRAESDLGAPHVAAAGPLLSTLDHWLNLPAERQFMLLKDEPSARAGVRYLAATGSTAVKVWFIVRSPDLTVEASTAAVNAAGQEARRLNLPLIVHATGLAEAKAALRAGARLLVHSVDDLPIDDEFVGLMKKNGAILTPTLTVRRGYVRLFEGVASRQKPATDDPNHCIDPATTAKIEETAKLQDLVTINPVVIAEDRIAARRSAMTRGEQVMAANLMRLVGAGIPVAMGTDAGNPLTLHGPSIYAEMEAMQSAGMTPSQILMSATRTGATAMGRASDLGTLEKGKIADILIVSADPTTDIRNLRRIAYVMRGGLVRPISELSALASGSPAAPAN
jgi:imidazolonepropionase-like amidohydrolase